MENADASSTAAQTGLKKTNSIPNQSISLEEETQTITLDLKEPLQLRMEVYKEASTRKLLKYLLEDEKNVLTPAYNPAKGFAYEKIEQILGEDTTRQTPFEILNRLTKLDILQKSFFDSATACPNCQSTVITIHRICPYCKSHQVSNTSLTEHVTCGFIAEREQYVKGLCPKCGNPINEHDFRNMGSWYICKDCKDKFDMPDVEYVCRECGNSFNVESGKTIELSKYNLNPQRMREVRENVVSIEGISQIIEELGFSLKEPATIVGKQSGMKHHFSIIAQGNHSDKEVTIAVEKAVADFEVQASALIVFIYKISEVQVDLPIFVAIPKLSEDARKIAQGRNILVIEGIPTSKADLLRLGNQIEARIHLFDSPVNIPEEGEGKRALLGRSMFKREELKPNLIDVIPSIHPAEQLEETKKSFVSAIKKTFAKEKTSQENIKEA